MSTHEYAQRHEPQLVASPVTIDGVPVSAHIKLVCLNPDCHWVWNFGVRASDQAYLTARQQYQEDHDRG